MSGVDYFFQCFHDFLRIQIHYVNGLNEHIRATFYQGFRWYVAFAIPNDYASYLYHSRFLLSRQRYDV